MIKFWSYKREYSIYKKNILNLIDKSISSGFAFFGKNLQTFEKNFVKKYNSNYGVAVGSGTEALLISLMAIGIKKGDEVITASNTAIPTISAIVSSGAKPVLVDINVGDYLINTVKIEKFVTKKTKAIIPIHLYGQSADLEKILILAKKKNIKVIEDCAQAQGAKYKNKYVGTLGDLGCFSFYPTKILGAYGDGGFILTQNYKLYKKIKRIRFYGIETIDRNNRYFKKYYANENGVNSRLDEIQASILNFKLKKVDTFIKRRREIARLYNKELQLTNLRLPTENPGNFHVYHLFTVFHKKSKNIINELIKKKIETRIIYPYPIQKMRPYKKFVKRNGKDLKKSEIISRGIFSLPLYPELKNREIILICKEIKKVLKRLNI